MTDRIIAIGDVHGCAKVLATLIEAIQPTGSDTLVFLGDYIDRGPDSRGVVEQVVALPDRCTVVPFLGRSEVPGNARFKRRGCAGRLSRTLLHPLLTSPKGYFVLKSATWRVL